jgi:hypothetical protein
MHGIDFVDFTADEAITCEETGVTPHIDQAAAHLGCA